MVMLIPFQCYDRIDGWDLRRGLCCFLVRCPPPSILSHPLIPSHSHWNRSSSLNIHSKPYEQNNNANMSKTEESMSSIYKAKYVSLHVRKSNLAAIGLYRDTLGFEVAQLEKKYCEFLSCVFFCVLFCVLLSFSCVCVFGVWVLSLGLDWDDTDWMFLDVFG